MNRRRRLVWKSILNRVQADSFRRQGKFFLPTLHFLPNFCPSTLDPLANPTPDDISREL
jgi:hypothetical protein